MEDTTINYTNRKPIGVVGCISPWNLPLYLFTWKIAPALAAGNTVVAKPSEVTPMTAFLLSELCIQAGLPKGVLNIVHGLGPSAGDAIISHPKIKAISFTGGTKTGAYIASKAAPMFKNFRLNLEAKTQTSSSLTAILTKCSEQPFVLLSPIKDKFAFVDPESLLNDPFMINSKLHLLKK